MWVHKEKVYTTFFLFSFIFVRLKIKFIEVTFFNNIK